MKPIAHRIHNKPPLTYILLDNDKAILFQTALAPLQQLEKIICVHRQEGMSAEQQCHRRQTPVLYR